jgi:hypothetical protein
VTLPREQQDPGLDEKLAREADAIFACMVVGAKPDKILANLNTFLEDWINYAFAINARHAIAGLVS